MTCNMAPSCKYLLPERRLWELNDRALPRARRLDCPAAAQRAIHQTALSGLRREKPAWAAYGRRGKAAEGFLPLGGEGNISQYRDGKKGEKAMRCGCPECGAYMVHADGAHVGCVCPDCKYRCTACLGTNSVLSREALRHLKENPELARRVMDNILDEDASQDDGEA